MVNFMKESIPGRASILAPITELTKKDVKSKWTKEQDDCFNKCKAMISKRILMTYPDPNDPFMCGQILGMKKGWERYSCKTTRLSQNSLLGTTMPN